MFTGSSSTNKGSTVKKGRGVSNKTPNWGKIKLQIEFDSDWQPCDGEYVQLVTQLGFYVKDGTAFPLTADTWNDIETANIERIWAEIQKILVKMAMVKCIV